MGTVLIVEDEAMIRAIALAEFEYAEHEVIEAADGDTALRALQPVEGALRFIEPYGLSGIIEAAQALMR